ncbi:hypothetical protein GOODEAATRI_021206 [Goodea atripinnis]|uniref:SMC hinge domain-containing protein n=1 Tax=Goodea atripinnis TaxID=208336 RepID=A0ABV0NWM1_9TELE
MVDDLNLKRLELSLVELYHNEKGISAISDTHSGKKQFAAQKNSELEHILAQSSSQYIKAKVNTSHHTKKAAEIRDAVKKNGKMLAVKEQELAEGRQEIAELERTWKRYEKQTQEGVARGRDIDLDEAQCNKVLYDSGTPLKIFVSGRRACLQSLSMWVSVARSPVHKKYQLAVTKVFGRNMSAIVVASEKVARDCISFIKEERAEPETFLPIDYLVVNPLNERLRQIPGAKMVVDVVQVNAAAGAAQLGKVVQYVCGNALVCETMKDARNVAFDRQERVRTVTLDGTLFKTSGVISGGSSYLRTKARCWDEKDMIRLKERRHELISELRVSKCVKTP